MSSSINTIRHSAFEKFRGRILDVGCGNGAHSIDLLQNNHECHVIGIDIDPCLLEKARQTARELDVADRVEFILEDGNKMKFPPSEFDAIFFRAALHHLASWKEVLSETKYWLKGGGILYLEEPLKNNPIAKFGLRVFYSVGSLFLNVHKRPDKNQWPFDPSELLEEVARHYRIKHVSYHGFLSSLFAIASNYARNAATREFLNRMSSATIGIDLLVECSPHLQRWCSIVIIQAENKSRRV